MTLIKIFRFNEFEFLCYTIYIEKLNWIYEHFSPIEFLYVLGFSVKFTLSNRNKNLFFYYRDNLSDIVNAYIDWMSNDNNLTKIRITEKEINSKYISLTNVIILL